MLEIGCLFLIFSNNLINEVVILLLMKCSICGKKIDVTFMNKILGTYVKKKDSSKKYPVCFECQKKCTTKEELLKNIK
jgi:hypothetical protein